MVEKKSHLYRRWRDPGYGGWRGCQLQDEISLVSTEWMPVSNRPSEGCQLHGTDSRGGCDAITKNESPLLGLSNVRSALQAFQLPEQLQDGKGSLIGISGHWNLSDALTKKDKSCGAGLSQFVKNWMWKLTYGPNFIQSEKKAKKLGQGAVSQMRQLCSMILFQGNHFDFPME